MTGPAPAPLLLDVTHTSHTRARTGIQRVVRSLHAALGGSCIPVTFDPFANRWRALQPWEHANLAAETPASRRGARWPLRARLMSRAMLLLRRAPAPLPVNSGLIMPEVFSPLVARALPRVFGETPGPRIAIFHDAIALKLPELTPAKTVARFPGYLLELLAFDGVAAISEESRRSLVDYWTWLGVRDVPPVHTIGWGIDLPRATPASPPREQSAPPVILSVGSIEGRKNHLALVEACEQLWSAGERFELHLVGLAQTQTGAAALARIQALQASGRALRYDGPVSDHQVDAAYARCAFTVYPSLMEGFGLPVLESLAHGKPCICSGRGALGEAAGPGGCLTLDRMDAASLATAIRRVLRTPDELARLQREAGARSFKTWTEYAAELRGWMDTLRRRN